MDYDLPLNELDINASEEKKETVLKSTDATESNQAQKEPASTTSTSPIELTNRNDDDDDEEHALDVSSMKSNSPIKLNSPTKSASPQRTSAAHENTEASYSQPQSPLSDGSLSIKSSSPKKQSPPDISPIKFSNPASAAQPTTRIQQASNPQSKSVYVSKIDAGIAILLTHDLHLIEWPVSLLPSDISEGTYFDLNIVENKQFKSDMLNEYKAIQEEIFELYGKPKDEIVIKCLARGQGIFLEVAQEDMQSIKSVSIFLDDQQYKKSFQMLSKNSILINVEQDKTYTVYIKAQTANGLVQSNTETIQVV